MFLTQFSNKGSRQQFWKDDLERAAKKTVADWTPKCEANSVYGKIEKIMKKLRKRSPRKDWLLEKAYCWLKNAEIRNAAWYPQQAIRVAHTLFLGKSGKFESFMKYLKNKSRRRQPPIDTLIEAHESIATSPTGLGSRTEQEY